MQRWRRQESWPAPAAHVRHHNSANWSETVPIRNSVGVEPKRCGVAECARAGGGAGAGSIDVRAKFAASGAGQFCHPVNGSRDRRVRLIALTKLGIAKFKEAEPYWEMAQERFEKVFGKEEAATLRSVLLGIAYNRELGKKR